MCKCVNAYIRLQCMCTGEYAFSITVSQLFVWLVNLGRDSIRYPWCTIGFCVTHYHLTRYHHFYLLPWLLFRVKFLGTMAPQECMAGTRSVLCNGIPRKGGGWLLCTNIELRDSKVVTMCWRAPQDANPSSISIRVVCVCVCFFFPSYFLRQVFGEDQLVPTLDIAGYRRLGAKRKVKLQEVRWSEGWNFAARNGSSIPWDSHQVPPWCQK